VRHRPRRPFSCSSPGGCVRMELVRRAPLPHGQPAQAAAMCDARHCFAASTAALLAPPCPLHKGDRAVAGCGAGRGRPAEHGARLHAAHTGGAVCSGAAGQHAGQPGNARGGWRGGRWQRWGTHASCWSCATLLCSLPPPSAACASSPQPPANTRRSRWRSSARC
jgi:hypothetical protein